MKKELLILIGLIFTFIFIRSLHFPEHLNFSVEQASFSLEAARIWDEKSVELVGPPISFRMGARYIFQGSITYYFMLPFLLLGSFDPVLSSYMMVVFSSLMIIPLYFGTKFLINKQAGLTMAILFALLPLYIDYSRFFWNPNAQFLLTPLLILSMGLYAKKKKSMWLFVTGGLMGMLLLFHYQFGLIILGLLGYYGYTLKKKKDLSMIVAGIIVGFSPMLVFEARNAFYNTQTILLFFQNLGTVLPKSSNMSFPPHYFLSISLFVLLGVLYGVRKYLKQGLIFGLFAVLLIFAVQKYAVKPTHGFGMKEDWNVLHEKYTYDIIKSQNLENYNIVHLGYDTLANAQKYFHYVDDRAYNFDDYYENEYLFVVSEDADFMDNPAYEVNTFVPSTVLETWKINDRFDLYLLKR